MDEKKSNLKESIVKLAKYVPFAINIKPLLDELSELEADRDKLLIENRQLSEQLETERSSYFGRY